MIFFGTAALLSADVSGPGAATGGVVALPLFKSEAFADIAISFSSWTIKGNVRKGILPGAIGLVNKLVQWEK